ncbi:hypothetical protein O181_133354 [Austropuccinia psidii MF-1]|uniref:Uncharacterized protein n=1 Tax=Austropuccinia psidii MF-1 TaxID=1389203 RepID=A0A9Q3L6J1_9BASI|nr:hypothetical protein [Austropuccinia psidii MF-1]
MASGNQQRPPAQLQERIPLSFRGRLLLSQCTPYSRIQEWCIYGIIYHYAPFILRNPMETFSGPNYVIPNQVPNPSPISKEDLSAISVWQFPGGYQKTIQGPQPPGPAGVGLSFLIRIILRVILRGYINHFNHCQDIKYSEFFGKLNWSIKVVIKNHVWPWLIWANSYSTMGIQSKSSILNMARTLLTQLRQ